MRCPTIVLGLIALLAVAAPEFVAAGSNVNLEDISWESWSNSDIGDPLPVGGPVIRVYSEKGDRFDFVGHANQPIRFWGLLSGSCGRVYKISYLQLKVAGETASVPHPENRGAWFSRYGAVDVPPDSLESFDAVRACNDKLKTLAAETGRSRANLVAQGFGIHYPDWIEGRGVLMCTGRNNSDSDTVKLDLWVQCVGNPKAAEKELPMLEVIPATLSPLIADLEYEVDRPNYTGECPVGLKFTGSITTSRAGTIKYRSVAQDGSSSPTYTLKFGAAGTKAVTLWSETLSAPDASGTLAAAPTSGGPDHQGWRRLQIVEPAGFAPSPPAEYSVTCRKGALAIQAAPVEATKKPSRIKQ